MRRLSASVITAAVLLLWAHSAVFAQGRPSGIRISVTGVDSVSGQVDFDVTLNTNSAYGVPPAATPTGLLGDYLFTVFYATTYPPGYTGRLLNPAVMAIDYGDGNMIPRSKIANVGPGQFRGSFSHTYPGPGTYDLRATAAALLVGNTNTVVPTTGNAVTNPNQAVTTPTGAQSFLGSWYGRSFFGGALTYNLVAPIGGGQHVFGVSNSVTSGAPNGAPGGGLLILPVVPTLSIPTASEVGLLALAAAIAAAGVFRLVRRF